VLVVSHDRRFLDAVVSRIYELATSSPPTRAATPPTATRRRAAAPAWRSSPPPRTSAGRRLEADIAGTLEQARHTERTVSRAAAPHQKRLAKKVAKKAKSREHRLEREMASTDWVERPREAPAVR
jgi:ATP-binding cassette subfamily F protein 3